MSNITYNGKTLDEIANNFPPNMADCHREQYLNNCEFVFENETAGFNLDYSQLVRDTNFRLIQFYLTN